MSGPNATAVLATLGQLEISPHTDARAQLALTLAAAIDNAIDAGQLLGVASMAKELRATLGELEKGRHDHDDGLAGFLAELSTPVRHTPST
jgi:hypothetical protein